MHGESTDRCRVNVSVKFHVINEGVFEWFCAEKERREKHPFTDEIILAYAARLAKALNTTDSKITNVWLWSLKPI